MSVRVAIGLDVGTSGLKAVAVDEDGLELAAAGRSYPLLTPRPGWSEQEPEEWWQAAVAAIPELLQRLREAAGGFEIVALGLSGQMHGLVPIGAHGRPVRPAILWNDQRTGEAVRELERRIPRSDMIGRTGNPAITGFQLAKLVWMQRNEPEEFARTTRVLFPKDYLGYRLTGELYAEPTDASGSNAFNLFVRSWDGDILAALDLGFDLWPDVAPSDAVVGALTGEAARATGLPVGLDVVAGAGDNSAAAYGMGLGRDTPGLGSVSLGTSGVIFAPQDSPDPDPDGRVHLFCHADGGYHLLAVTLAAAGSLAWFRDSFLPGRDLAELTAMAEAVPPGAGGVTFKPYLAGERTPHLDPDLRGSFHGLSLAADAPHLVRAVLEGVAFSLRDALDVLTPLSELERAFLTGGGARSRLWAQLLADVLRLPLGVAENAPGPAYGAARLALRAAGAAAPEPDEQRVDWLEPAPEGPYTEALARYRELGP